MALGLYLVIRMRSLQGKIILYLIEALECVHTHPDTVATVRFFWWGGLQSIQAIICKRYVRYGCLSIGCVKCQWRVFFSIATSPLHSRLDVVYFVFNRALALVD